MTNRIKSRAKMSVIAVIFPLLIIANFIGSIAVHSAGDNLQLTKTDGLSLQTRENTGYPDQILLPSKEKEPVNSERNAWQADWGITSIDPNNPTMILSTQKSLIYTLTFNSSVKAYYYEVDYLATSSSPYSYMGFYLNVSSSLDVDLTLVIETPGGEQIGKSWNREQGKDELFILSPNQYPNLYNKPLFVNITAVSGSGEAEFFYRRADELNLVGKPSSSLYANSMALRAFDMIPLNYSSGENISATIFNYGSVGSNNRNVFEIYAFALNGNLSQSFKNWNIVITDEDMVPFGARVNIEIGIVPITEFDGIVLVLLGKEFPTTDEGTITIETVVTLPKMSNEQPTVIPRNQILSVNISSNKYSYFAFEVGTDKAVYSVTIDSFQGEFEHEMSRDPFFDQQYTYTAISSLESSAYYLIWKLNKYQLKPPQPGLSWYFFRLRGSFDNQSVQISIQEKSTYWVIGDSPQVSISVEIVEEGQLLTEVLYLSSSPAETIIWAEPPSNIDLEFAWFADTGSKREAKIIDHNGLGGIETTGQLQTASQEMYILLIRSKKGTGSFTYYVRRGADISPPNINSVSFGSLNISNLEILEFSVNAIDDAAVYNVTLEYRARDTQDTWNRFQLASPTSAIPVYGEWELRVVVFDVAGNKAVDDNNSEYYLLTVRDEKPPEITDITLEIQPRKNATLTVNVSDPDSGIDTVLVEYRYLLQNISGSVIATPISGNLYQIELPSGEYGEELEVTIIATDKSGNIKSSSKNVRIEEKVVAFDVIAPARVEVSTNVTIDVGFSANIEIVTAWMAYVFENQPVGFLNATQETDQTYLFTIIFHQDGVLTYWFFAKDTDGEVTVSSNYTLVFGEIEGTNSNTNTSPNDTNSQNGGKNNDAGSSNSTDPVSPESGRINRSTLIAILGVVTGIGGGTAIAIRTDLKGRIKNRNRS